MESELLHEALCIFILDIALSFELSTLSETSKEVLADCTLHMTIHTLPCLNHIVVDTFH